MPDYKIIKLDKNLILRLFEYSFSIIRCFKRPIVLIFRMIHNGFPLKAVTRDNLDIVFHKWSTFYIYIKGNKWRKMDNYYEIHLKKSGLSINYRDILEGDLWSVFGRDEYSYLDVANKDVIDIGANVGDSSLYFLSKGANKVIAVEPFPSTFGKLQDNVLLNQELTENAVYCINAALDCDSGTINLDPRINDTIGLKATHLKSGNEVNTINLEWILDSFDLESPVLKIDCEGCEYEVILNASQSHLSRFSQIQIEYHMGYKPLLDKLTLSGFGTMVTKPVLVSKDKNVLELGQLIANRINQ